MGRSLTLLAAALLVASVGCADPEPEPEPAPSPPSHAAEFEGRQQDEPEHLQGKLRIYTLYRPQVQRRNFNGVFDIAPRGRGSRIVHRFWKRRFAELTRPGFYGEFFTEFYDYMGFLAQAYPADSAMKEAILNSLEKSFRMFCKVIGVAEEFEEFQIERQKTIGDG